MQQAVMAQGVAEHSDVRSLDWFQFEKLVGILFQQEGFAVRRFGGANADDGIDLTATKNGVTFGVQCKQWKTWRVGVKDVRAFLGALHDQHLRHGFLVTLEGYTKEAADFAQRNQIDLLDETLLLQNLEEVSWTRNPAFAAVLNDPVKFCPKCESEMVLRTATKGTRVGSQFWGCKRYPQCNFRMSLR
jgi:restriction system protein